MLEKYLIIALCILKSPLLEAKLFQWRIKKSFLNLKCRVRFMQTRLKCYKYHWENQRSFHQPWSREPRIKQIWSLYLFIFKPHSFFICLSFYDLNNEIKTSLHSRLTLWRSDTRRSETPNEQPRSKCFVRASLVSRSTLHLTHHFLFCCVLIGCCFVFCNRRDGHLPALCEEAGLLWEARLRLPTEALHRSVRQEQLRLRLRVRLGRQISCECLISPLSVPLPSEQKKQPGFDPWCACSVPCSPHRSALSPVTHRCPPAAETKHNSRPKTRWDPQLSAPHPPHLLEWS